ncbi:Uncharacterised protein [Klebsiella pneumoniae subsp. ozaenae]|uniref:Uncharacterized protein n=1 Tax=Klebsiella pneumoniae subsp. ozaenae TaxID=574 RepID=A0A377Z260_KLEPO|nr:Uncharacterised protein [Klebsiella pneumoniae subsp. ozaenae]
MSKNIEIKNTSTELFYDLAKRSFEASWKTMQICVVTAFRTLLMTADFMSAFIRLTINHVCHNFDKFYHAGRPNHGNIEEVNYEEVGRTACT